MSAGNVLKPRALDDRPVFGTTLYLATCPLDTRSGPFRTYSFHDIINKHYASRDCATSIVSLETSHTERETPDGDELTR